MKNVAIYILAVISLCLASCISLEESFINPDQGGPTLKIMASVADFSNVKVGTKALEDEESEVNEITMIIFDSNNNIVGRPVNLSGANSVFMIDTQNAKIIDGENHPIDMVAAPVTQTTLKSCSIYMVANCWHVLENETISTLNDLLTVDIPVEAIGIPKLLGIPMIGSEEGFDLSSTRGQSASTLADIVMEKLYAKVNVRFQVNANQVIKIPSFTLKNWTVSGIPTNVRLGEPADGEQTANADLDTLKTTEPSSLLSYGMSTIKHSESAVNPEYLQFTFYVPEHRVNPNNTTFTYPSGIKPDEKQRYKPLLCKAPKKPMYVTINGIYSDHHGQVKEVTYSLYLGQNNSDNFHVNRNQELTNIVTITGLTNSKPDDETSTNISVDHRVEITSNKGYSIAVEREALLDSHFEVRPMDVFVSNGGKVVLTVNSTTAPDDGDDWLRMEESYKSSPTTHIVDVGVRKYFTSELVTNTLAEEGRSIELTENSRIWLYFDENTTNIYDKTVPEGHPHSKKFRDITLTVDYYADKNSSEITESQELSFRQINLWRVRNANNTRYYDIEYHEEYLYNYASDDNYGKRKDGMVWGLDGIQLSHIYDACYLNASVTNFWQWLLSLLGWSKEGLVNASFNQIKPQPKYDFYLSRDKNKLKLPDELTVRDFSGYAFNSEITTYLRTNYASNDKAKLTGIILTEDPKSAVAYCYNKNKRNANGEVEQLSWYLPASDEIEEIASSAYQEFDGVFQGNLYWSCQPAYIYNKLNADLYKHEYEVFGNYKDSGENAEGYYFLDDKNRARATRAQVDNGVFAGILDSGSELKGTQGGIVYVGNKAAELPEDKYVTSNAKPHEGHPGNLSRTNDYARVRCVHNSGLVSELNNNQ